MDTKCLSCGARTFNGDTTAHYLDCAIERTGKPKIKGSVSSSCPTCGELHVVLVRLLSTESLIEELKSRGLGTFNLGLPFHYIPKNEDRN